MDNREIERLITKRLAGEATPQELSDLRAWLECNEGNRAEFNTLNMAYQLSAAKAIDRNKKAKALERIKHRIESDKNKILVRKGRRDKNHRLIWYSIAASVALLLFFGFLYQYNHINSVKTQASLSKNIHKSNPAGQKSKVFLPDGSIVWLNSESSIFYENEFNDSTRHVHLSGEAFFEVKKDIHRPFVVYSGSISTTAIGTAFNINAFDENNITVALTEGKVNVQTSDEVGETRSLLINPGKGVLYNPSHENKISIIDINPEEVKMWKDGLLRLNHATLKETITLLERWYGVDIILNNEPLQKWEAIGTFANENLENVLNVLGFSQKFEYERKRKKIYITFKQ